MKIRKYFRILLILLLIWNWVLPVKGEETIAIEAPYAVLMEAETGEILYEKEAETKRSPASITKIMTLILIYDALEQGKITLDDEVVTSAHAKSMGGSQVFLEEGEIQTVETLIKCIVIASGNDASVAMAEYLEGSESSFVEKMNIRAEKLGMKNTHFMDCCGLTDSAEHHTTAKDVALMSRELICRYPQILEYSSIWMENITHHTAKGSSEFGLTNTNKMLRSYEGCVGLKTGSTSLAKYCVSAVAERKNIRLIAVIMAAPDYKVRFKDASVLLNHGFAKCSLYIDEEQEKLPQIPVKKGIMQEVSIMYKEKFRYLSTENEIFSEIKTKLILPEEVTAPIKKGEKAGEILYFNGAHKLGSVELLYGEDVKKARFRDCFYRIYRSFFDKK